MNEPFHNPYENDEVTMKKKRLIRCKQQRIMDYSLIIHLDLCLNSMRKVITK